MLIGVFEAGLVEPAAVLELLLLPLLLQAARTPTESATALMVMTFLENQGKVNLTPGSSFLLGQVVQGRARRHIGVLTFEGYTGSFSFLCDKCREINVTVTPRPTSPWMS
jgi:hypothetical protein